MLKKANRLTVSDLRAYIFIHHNMIESIVLTDEKENWWRADVCCCDRSTSWYKKLYWRWRQKRL